MHIRWLSCDAQCMTKIILTHFPNGVIELRRRNWEQPSSDNPWIQYQPTLGKWACISLLRRHFLSRVFPRRVVPKWYFEWCQHGHRRPCPLHFLHRRWKTSRKRVVGRCITPTLDHLHRVSWPQVPKKKRFRKVYEGKSYEIAYLRKTHKHKTLKPQRLKSMDCGVIFIYFAPLLSILKLSHTESL